MKYIYSVMMDPSAPLSVRLAATLVVGFFLLSLVVGLPILTIGLAKTFKK